MPSLPAPRGPVPPLPAARGSSRARWLGAVACAAVLSGWFVASRTDGSEPLALSAEGARPEALAATALEPLGDPATASLTRKPASDPEEHDVAGPGGPGLEASPSADALLVAGCVAVRGGSSAEDAPLGQARLYVEARRRQNDGRLGTWTTTPLRALSDATGRFSIAVPTDGTPGAIAIAAHTRHGQALVGLRVTARRIGHFDASADFEPGAADVQLTLAGIGTLAVRIVHGGAEDGPRFSLALETRDQRLERASVAHEREVFSGVPSGEATLTVWIQGDPDPLVVLQNLAVPPGAACNDPRLDPLDLSARVTDYAVRVVNDLGEVVRRPLFAMVSNAHWPANEPEPRGGLRALAEIGEVGAQSEGWWRVHARAPAAPEVVVSAIDHEASAPTALQDGATIRLRSAPRLIVVLSRDPPPGSTRIELQRVSPTGPSDSISIPAERFQRVPRPLAGRARARLTFGGQRDVAKPTAWKPETTGPWVEFDVPESGECRVLLDLPL